MAEKPHIDLLRSGLSWSLEENLSIVRRIMNIPPNRDVVLRRFSACGLSACLVFMDGMVSRSAIDQFILRPCMGAATLPAMPSQDRLAYLARNVIAIDDAREITGFQELAEEVLSGKAVLLAEDCSEALALEARGYDMRQVDKTSTESVVYGPKEGFVENLRSNVTLIRRILRSEALVSEMFTIGTRLPTQVSLLYLKGVVKEESLERARRRVRALNVPQCPGTGYLQQLIEDHPYSLLPQMLETERPDRAASCLSDGQVVILVDGSPYALIAPISFWHLVHASDDSFMRWQYGTFVRVIRMLGILLSLLVPGCYVALTVFHQHMIPTELLTSIIEARAKVAFPVVVEVLIMDVSFFLLNEAGTRVPTLIGPSVGLVGALILGQAAVSAAIISPILIIVIAITGLGNYTVPNYGVGIGIQIARLALVFLGALLGFYGIILAVALILCRLCAMTSLGEAYMAPVAPYKKHNGDILIRAPLWRQTQPLYLGKRDSWTRKAPGSVRAWRRRR